MDAAVVTWASAGKSAQGLAARSLFLCFTVLLALKIDKIISLSWWVVFVPLWIFHAVIVRHRFSLPAPLLPHGRQWAPSHAVVATPLVISFELLICIYLGNRDAGAEPAIDLKIVFLPLLAFEVAILIDNFRMCRNLIPTDEESMTGEAMQEILPHFWIAISMVFLVAATSFMLLKLCGDFDALGWWEIFMTFGIAECFSFLVCSKWLNPVIHRSSPNDEAISSSAIVRYINSSSSLMSSTEDQNEDRSCGLQDIGGHMMKVPLVVFQILLYMRLEGTPVGAQHIPVLVIFVVIFVVQGIGIFFIAWRFVEKLFILIKNVPPPEGYVTIASRAYDLFAFLHHGSRLLGWWTIDEGTKEEQARLICARYTGYDTFCGYPPDVVKKLTKKDLTQEVWRLQAALYVQTEISKYSHQECERLQNEKVLCRVCFEEDICVVLLPCRHHILCKHCSKKCHKCPICRATIEESMQLCDV